MIDIVIKKVRFSQDPFDMQVNFFKMQIRFFVSINFFDGCILPNIVSRFNGQILIVLKPL